MKHYHEVEDFTVAPWKMYPELPYRSMGWRMGYGQFYIFKWHTFYTALNGDARCRYKEQNPEPDSWQGFYQRTDVKIAAIYERKKKAEQERLFLENIYGDYLATDKSDMWNDLKQKYQAGQEVNGRVKGYMGSSLLIDIGELFPTLIWSSHLEHDAEEMVERNYPVGSSILAKIQGFIDQRRVIMLEQKDVNYWELHSKGKQ